MKTNKIHDKTVIEYETELSHYNRKTLDITRFKEYLQDLRNIYKQKIISNLQFHRKVRF